MSMLTPLYVLGLLAVSLPVIFHLIRRMPRGQVPFSSLMFLSPSPPRLTRRSRLENILLLILRGAVLSLLAFAFARPFLRQQVPLDSGDAERSRIAIVVDTSASMRRGDLWRQAVSRVDEVLAELRPFDQLAVFTCDTALRPLVGFEDMSKIEPAQRRGLVSARLRSASPSWAATHLGQGLMDVVEIVNNDSGTANDRDRVARRVVLVSDMQQGSRFNALADYPWPEEVRLELRRVAVTQKTNAGIHWLAERSTTQTPANVAEVRVRVANDADSAANDFELEWLDENGRAIGTPVATHVPAGESRIVRVRRLNERASRLQLSGDNCDFDNMLYFANRAEAAQSVVYLGADEPADPEGLRFYLERALTDGLTHPVNLETIEGEKPLAVGSATETPLVVVTFEPSQVQARELKQYIESGGTALFVLTEAKPYAAVASIVNQPALDAEEAKVDGYAMLGKVDFAHPLFAPMAAANFNDLTQINFWKYRHLDASKFHGANVLAQFENGDPALVEWRLGRGSAYLLTSGWHPADSQFARSWKFVLFVSTLVEGDRASRSNRKYFVVNEPVPLSEEVILAGNVSVTKPDGTKMTVAEAGREFVDTSMPGVYSLNSGDIAERFAVNLDPLESRTAAVGAETLEQFGCRLVGANAVAEQHERRQYLQDVQLESRQKFWQWLILAALGLVVAETWLAGRATKQPFTEGHSS
ncbi:MAG TPA: BatA domain-containing protein [Lacipirellulaceae bacterium]|nr:BatA domain-containing protein [Lacipirellulaceae bacterium]